MTCHGCGFELTEIVGCVISRTVRWRFRNGACKHTPYGGLLCDDLTSEGSPRPRVEEKLYTTTD